VHVLALTNQLGAVKSQLDLQTLETTWGPGWTVAHMAAKARALECSLCLLGFQMSIMGDQSCY